MTEKYFKSSPESDSKAVKIESGNDSLMKETGKAMEGDKENPEIVAERINELRKDIDRLFDDETSEAFAGQASASAESVKRYQDCYLPTYLKKKGGLLSRSLADIWTMGTKFEIIGEKNIPESGPYLVVCNHFGAGDTQAILKTFKKDNLHLVVGKSIWWDGSVISRWFLKKLKAIPVQESLSNLSQEEKESALMRQGKMGKIVFRKIIDKEKRGELAVDTSFIRQAVAVLSQGDAVGIFPEGLWLNPQGVIREKAEMKRGYGGMELIASQYKKLTGVDLSILPTAFNEDQNTKEKKLIIGKEINLTNNNSKLNGTDWCMSQIAALLPMEKRGYYTKLAEANN